MAGLFDVLEVWFDRQPRTGAENMAIDQLLLERVDQRALLRVYAWSEPTVSFGYSVPFADVRDAFPEQNLNYVRRWTGGGVVDHRADLTYTLVVPRAHGLASMRGAASYAEIHGVLAKALERLGEQVFLESGGSGVGTGLCYSNPVDYDLIKPGGGKIAGAGQRRTRDGLLHQGSLLADCEASVFCRVFADRLATASTGYEPRKNLLEDARVLARERYDSEPWLLKR